MKSYRKAEELRKERVNQEMWLQGMYIYDAISRLSPILRAFAKRERKPNLMLRKHIPSIKRRWRKQNSRRKRLSLKRVCAYMQAYMVQANKQLQERK